MMVKILISSLMLCAVSVFAGEAVDFHSLAKPGSAAPEMAVDTTAPAKFDGEKVRVKLDEKKLVNRYSAGTVDLHGSTGFALTAYLWKGALDAVHPEKYFVVESSADGVHFSPVKLRYVRQKPGEFCKYALSNAAPLPAGTRLLRVLICVRRADQAWVAQVGKIQLFRRGLQCPCLMRSGFFRERIRIFNTPPAIRCRSRAGLTP